MYRDLRETKTWIKREYHSPRSMFFKFPSLLMQQCCFMYFSWFPYDFVPSSLMLSFNAWLFFCCEGCVLQDFPVSFLLPGESESTVPTEVSLGFEVKTELFGRSHVQNPVRVNCTDPHGIVLVSKDSAREEVSHDCCAFYVCGLNNAPYSLVFCSSLSMWFFTRRNVHSLQGSHVNCSSITWTERYVLCL